MRDQNANARSRGGFDKTTASLPAVKRSTFTIRHTRPYGVVLLTLLFLISCYDKDVLRKQLFFRMDTVTEITVSVPKSFDVKPVWRGVDSLLSLAEERFSSSGGSSEIRILNERGSAGALSVSPELCDMLKTGLAYGDTLNGAFDITVMPLKELWGFCELCGDDDPLPDPATVDAALRRVDYRRIRVNESCDSVFFDSEETRVDAGGIAKGYVLMWVNALLKDFGICDFVIAAGGDIVVSGRKSGNLPWRVGIRHPRDNSGLIATLPIESGALVTSGDYERFRIADGVRYHHIFDPSTGYPCGRNQSLTIWAADPVRADILSTGLFCRDTADILEFVNARADLECFIVDDRGVVFESAGWERRN